MINKRKLFYKLPASARFIIRQLYYMPEDLIRKISGTDELQPPKGMIYTGGGDFKATGQKFCNYFDEYGGLKVGDHVLDIGSGIGRMAIPLTNYLNSEARYEGFDAVEKGVKWCQDNITNRYPNFNFQYIDLHNDLYKKGGQDASEFVFPFKDNQFDFVFLISVFTHMVENEVIQYLKEIYRVLKPGGRCFSTFFLIDEMTAPARTDFQFKHDSGNTMLMDNKVKGANVAYNISFLSDSLRTIGFKVTLINRGSWQTYESDESLDFQDVIVFEKV